jgi:hypothetical protein
MFDLTDFLPSRDKILYSAGGVCGLLRITPGQLRVLMEETGTQFSAVLDGVPYVTVDGLNAVAGKCREVIDEIEGKLSAADSN